MEVVGVSFGYSLEDISLMIAATSMITVGMVQARMMTVMAFPGTIPSASSGDEVDDDLVSLGEVTLLLIVVGKSCS